MKYCRSIFLFFLVFSLNHLFAQSGLCDPITPFYSCNLTGNPNGTWISPIDKRDGNCCNTTAPDKCIEFNITLDPKAVAINFNIASGAVPPGAMFYQINCGPPVAVGTPLCLNGPGPYTLTFCKPGNNTNTYAITSIAAPSTSPDDTVGNGCNTIMYASGLLEDGTITWNSIFPGALGAYNNYLSCTIGCDSTIVTALPGAPAYIDFQVCGKPLAGPCVPAASWCDTIRIYFSPPLLASINPSPAIFCANNPAGVTLTASAIGGVPPYSYSWVSGTNGIGPVVGNSATYNATAAGNYSVIIYDQNYPDCPPAIANVTVTVSPAPIVNAGPDRTICGNSVQLNGTVLNATGGIWSGGNGTFSPNNTTGNAVYTPTPAEMTAGIIILTYTSTGNGPCNPVSDQVIIRIAPPVNVTITGNSIVCSGQTTTLTASITSGQGPFTFFWNNYQTSQTISNVTSGLYIVTVTGQYGCTGTASILVTNNPAINLTTSPNNLISCTNTANISASATGGAGGFSYMWSNGDTTTTSVVYTGTYTVTVTDAVGCTKTATVSVLASNSTLTASVNQPGTICYGTTATLTVTASGGFGSTYSYLWGNSNTTNSITVGAGNHCVTVTDSLGCKTIACATVTMNSQIQVTIPTPPTICNGATTTANAAVNGGQAPYSYLWSNNQTTFYNNAGAGTYTVIVTDNYGCTATGSVTINEATPININFNNTNVSCFGGSNGISIATASGGTPGYNYSWAPNANFTSTLNGLSAGTYTVTVTDAMGCSAVSSTAITQPALLSATSSNSNVACFGGSNGSATINAIGGTTPYSYFWFPVGGSASSNSNLTSGSYTVTITDFNGCTTTNTFTITQPSAITINSTTTATKCGLNNGSATLTVSGGTGAYSYSWNPAVSSSSFANNLAPGNYTVTVTDANLCQQQTIVSISATPFNLVPNFTPTTACLNTPTSFANTTVSSNDPVSSWQWNFGEPISGTNNTSSLQNPTHTYLAPGTYTVSLIVTTLNGCIDTISYNVNVLPIPTANFSYTSICANSTTIFTNSSTISVGNITSWQWNFGDPNSGINNTSFLANPTHIYTQPGSYQVTLTVMGSNGCTSSTSQTISIKPVPVANFTATNVCEGLITNFTDQSTGNITNWSWNFGNNSAINTFQNPIYTYLNSGSYNVVLTVTNSDGCSSKDSNIVTVYPKPIVNFISQNVCFNSPINFIDSSTTPLGSLTNWVWDLGNSSTLITTQNVNYLYPTIGTYNVILTVTNSFGCTASFTKPVNVYPQPVANFSAGSVCFNTSTQFTDLSTVNNGSINSWAWNFGNGSPINNTQHPAYTYNATGIYNVTLIVSSNFGCKDTITKPLIIQPAPIANFIATDTTGCKNHCANFFDASIAGLSPITTWQWNFGDGNSANTQNTSNCYASSGYYTVTLIVTNAVGCSDTISKINLINIFPTPTADFSYAPQYITSLYSLVDFTDQSSSDAVTWQWNFGDPLDSIGSTLQNPSYDYPAAGNYCIQLIVMNNYKCYDTTTKCIDIIPEFTFYIPNAFTPGDSEGLNDTFNGVGTNIKTYNMWIYDRWGNMIFYTDDLNKGWDGRANGGKDIAQIDVYVYKVVLYDFGDNKHTYRGTVTIVR